MVKEQAWRRENNGKTRLGDGEHAMVQTYQKVKCINGLDIGSDHSPIDLTLDFMEPKGRRKFHFENIWLEKVACREVIHEAWTRGGSTRKMGDLEPKLEACKRSLIDWRKTEFKHNIKEINKARERLQNLNSRNLTE